MNNISEWVLFRSISHLEPDYRFNQTKQEMIDLLKEKYPDEYQDLLRVDREITKILEGKVNVN